MKAILRNIVCLSLLIATGLPARALTIVRTNDPSMSNTSIISAANAAAASAAFDYAAAQIMALYNDPIQINITLNAAPGTSTLGGSSTPLFGVYTYAQVKAALIADGSTADDITFNATLPATNPSASDRYFIPRAMQKALGLRASDATLDGTFSFGAGYSYTFDPNNRTVPGKFDFIAIAFHEITEIMGRIPGLGGTIAGSAAYLPYDLHRFSSSGVRNMTNGPGIYFSINNGVTNGKDYNDGSANTGDPQDWLGLDADAYNAFTGTNVMNPWSAVDIQVMDVIGYNRVACSAPSFTACPGNQTANTVLNGCTAAVSYTATASGTPAPYVTYAFNGATTGSGAGTGSGSTFNKGTTNVTLTASSGCGNSATCSFTVTVSDHQAPTVTCPADITAYTGPGRTTCDQVVTFSTPTGSDNCGAVTVSASPPSGSTFPVGTTTVTVTATDGSSNTSNCTFDITVIDNTAPDAQCKPATVHLSGGAASIIPGDVDNSSTDNCGIVSRSVSPNTFDCSQIGGTYPVVLTLTDAANNSSNCTAMVTVAGTPVSCTIGVASCAPAVCTNAPVTTIFLGYGPQCATMTANATGGDGGGYTYSWSPGTNLSCTTCQSPVFTPTAAGCYTYTVTVTNVNSGCSSTCNVTFCVKDIRVPGQPGKVYVCHLPPDNPANIQTIAVSVNAVPIHVCAHGGDRLGKCDDPCVCAPVARMATPVASVSGLNVIAYPNPFRNVINVRFDGTAADKADIKVYDATGRMLETRQGQHAGVDISVGEKLVPGIYTVEVKQGNTSQKIRIVKY